jgi:GT2 family glycosyltransferase
MSNVTIVVLGKYEEVFSGFRETADKHLRNYQKIFVRDGSQIPDPGNGWQVVQGPETFSMAGNANLGLKAAPSNSDVLYVGDDVRFMAHDSVEMLRLAAYSDPKIGILSPVIQGNACNPLQTNPHLPHLTYTDRTLAFICVYFKRAMMDAIGFLDEEFNEYGFDDDDYCRRAMQAGWKLAVTPAVTIVHWEGFGSTFKRNPVWPVAKNADYYRRKWGA